MWGRVFVDFWHELNIVGKTRPYEVLEDIKGFSWIREREQFRVGNRFQTNLDQDGGESKEREEDEALDSCRPGPAFGEEGFEHEWEDYSAD